MKKQSKEKTTPVFTNYRHPDTFGIWLGYKVIKISAKTGKAHLQLKLRDDHLSSAKRIHGGVVAAFLDFACGATVFSSLGSGDFCSTVELKVNYFKPLFSGDRLDAHGEIKFRGKRLCVVHALVYRNGEEAPVAMATGTFNIVNNP